MAKYTSSTPDTTIPPDLPVDDEQDEATEAGLTYDEIQGFSYNALHVLGPNYLARKWLPAKGPYFVALVLAMRAFVYYDYADEHHTQKSRLFPEAATIAERAGMSRSKVFALLKDPEMKRFIKRIPRRRWDKEMQKEVVTSNLYMVLMDDPPTPEDEHLVLEEQERIDAIKRGDTIVEGRSTSGKISESTKKTLIAVQENDSDSRRSGGRNDRMTINISQEGVHRSASRDDQAVTAKAIRNGKIPNQDQETTRDEGTTTDNTITPRNKADRIESRRLTNSAPAAPAEEGIDAAAVLGERATWRVDAEVAAGGIIMSNYAQIKGTSLSNEQERKDAEAALTKILSSHMMQPTPTPVEFLGRLADIARRRVQNRAGHIEDGGGAGYYITVLCNMGGELRREHYDISKLERTTAKQVRKTQAEQRSVQAARTPARSRQSVYAQPAESSLADLLPPARSRTRQQAEVDYHDNLLRQALTRG